MSPPPFYLIPVILITLRFLAFSFLFYQTRAIASPSPPTFFPRITPGNISLDSFGRVLYGSRSKPGRYDGKEKTGMPLKRTVKVGTRPCSPRTSKG